MKRNVLTTVFVMLAVAVSAQGYARIDTVVTPYIEYDYQSRIDSAKPLWIFCQHPTINCNGRAESIEGDLLQYNYIDGDVEICGIEVWMYIQFDMTPYPPYYLYLYDALPDTFELMAQVPIVNEGAELLLNYWSPCYWSDDDKCDTAIRWNSDVNRRYRYYFDSSVHVADSFYVGFANNFLHATQWNDIHYPDSLVPEPDVNWGKMSTENAWYGHIGFPYRLPDCHMAYQKKKVRWIRSLTSGPLSDPPSCISTVNEWTTVESHDFYMVFPLIRTYDTIWTVDTPACLPVRGFQIFDRFGDTVLLRWDPDSEHSEYQISYGPQGMDPENGTFVNVTTNRWQHIDTMHTGAVMSAYVRTVCREMDTLRYSSWSNGVEWQTRYEGIVSPDEDVRLAARVYLRPNPATDRVEVVSPYGVKGIDVYGAHGIRWREFPAGTTAFDVSNWAKGTYVVMVHTLSGSVTKKLIVE